MMLQRAFKIFIMLALLILALGVTLNFDTSFLFANKEYAKEIETQAYIVTAEQACAVLRDPSTDITQPSNEELDHKICYLFLRVKNNGNLHAWGKLGYYARLDYNPITISIPELAPCSCKTSLIFLGCVVRKSNRRPTDISPEWIELYTR